MEMKYFDPTGYVPGVTAVVECYPGT